MEIRRDLAIGIACSPASIDARLFGHTIRML
jgi:hypothetical protein